MDAGTVSVGFGAEPAIAPMELERLYRIRMSLPAEQRAAVERQYEAHLAANPPGIAPAAAAVARPHAARSRPASTSPGPESLDPVEAAAFDVPRDPEVVAGVSSYADRPAYSPENLERSANLPPAAGPSGYADRSPAYSERNLGRAARGPMPQPRVMQGDVEGRVRELVSRGMDPQMAQVVAQAEIDNPQNPNDPNPTPPAVRAAIHAENVRRQSEAAAGQETWSQKNEREYGEGDRLREELWDSYSRGGLDARNYMPESADWRPETPASRKKWSEFATGGSLDRMAQYAPEEFNRRQEAAAAQRSKDAREQTAKRHDPTIDRDSGKTRGTLYREQQAAADRRMLRITDVPANLKLYRELAAMGIDPDQFGDPRSQFDRNAALNAKTKARQSGVIGKDNAGNPIPIGGRAGAVIRNAQMRQNPMEFLRRPDLTEDQRLATLFYMANGRGPTPNEVKQFQAKGLLEGVQMGLRQNLNVNQNDVAAAGMADRRARGAAAQQAAQEWYGKNVGMMSPWNQTRYNSLVALLQSPPYSLTPEEAAQVAGQFGPPKAG